MPGETRSAQTQGRHRAARSFASGALTQALVIVALTFAWEGYRWVGERSGLQWPFAVNARTMPHIYEMLGQLFEPSRRNGPMLVETLLHASLFTAREALAGFLVGATFGFIIAIPLSSSRLMQRSLLPYIVASQTIPILAIAPMVVIWLGGLGAPSWISVAVISAYLTFFPVTINTMRGLTSPEPRAIDLLVSYAAPPWAMFWKLRFPAALPYIFAALRISAPASVVGAIIGELPSSVADGLGSAILTFNQYYVSSPPSLWATNIIAAALGIAFFLVVVAAERAIVRRAPENVA